MNKPIQPCPRECEGRNAECHAHCEKWLEYEKEYKAYFEAISKSNEVTYYVGAIFYDSIHDRRAGKKQRRKPKIR